MVHALPDNLPASTYNGSRHQGVDSIARRHTHTHVLPAGILFSSDWWTILFQFFLGVFTLICIFSESAHAHKHTCVAHMHQLL